MIDKAFTSFHKSSSYNRNYLLAVDTSLDAKLYLALFTLSIFPLCLCSLRRNAIASISPLICLETLFLKSNIFYKFVYLGAFKHIIRFL